MAILAPGPPQTGYERPELFAPQGALRRLLVAAAASAPDKTLFRDAPGREAWSGRPSLELTNLVASEAVRRLARFFAELGLEPASRVGICLPHGTEAFVALLAAGDAGLTPCPIEFGASASELSNAIEAADIRAIVTQSRLGDELFAQKICCVAAGFYRLRFLMAFGPEVPDGVVDLDAVLLDRSYGLPRGSADGRGDDSDGGLVTFGRGSNGRRAFFRTYPSLVAASAPVVAGARLRPGDHIVSLLAADDLKGLATSFVPALVAGATVEAHAVFDAAALDEALSEPTRTHLVAPGWMEDVLRDFEGAKNLRSIILVHEPPVCFEGRPETLARTIDLVPCSELALLSGLRQRTGLIELDHLARPDGAGSPSRLLEVRAAQDGEIWLRGSAVAAPQHGSAEPTEWLDSGFRIERRDGNPVGIA